MHMMMMIMMIMIASVVVEWTAKRRLYLIGSCSVGLSRA